MNSQEALESKQVSSINGDTSFDTNLAADTNTEFYPQINDDPLNETLNLMMGPPAADDAPRKKRERTNAKAVEQLDLESNVVELFRSGSAASQKLNIAQGDISLCCRGLKFSCAGHRFRFYGETEDPYVLYREMKKKLKEEQRLAQEAETPADPLRPRTTRNSRGPNGITAELREKSVLAEPQHKVRTWRRGTVKLGHFAVGKWLPTSSEVNKELQLHRTRLAESASKNRIKGKRKQSGSFRMSI